ncbi:unnamed protein product [Gongylonema pulchrum]|uniref:DUF485 domain-containing protein n=1 Tax=Gongylonema pulchrum TaxID=637853 RepID=A0A183EXH8_9BILA|nr:unnamed protein product [Gongylonema pulchrum]
MGQTHRSLDDDEVLRKSTTEERISVLGIDLTHRPGWLRFIVLSSVVLTFYIAYGFIQVFD